MPPNPAIPVTDQASSGRLINRLLGLMSLFTLVMTIPQVLTIWLSHQAAGVSLLSWSAYLISALLWFWYGIQKHAPNIYLACIGWMAMDLGVIIGALLYR